MNMAEFKNKTIEGYNFSVEDVEAAARISDDELEAVAGGTAASGSIKTYIDMLKLAAAERKK